MLFFALFTAGFTVGVLMALWIFPPNVKEIEEQEVNALEPILETKQERVSVEGEIVPTKTVLSSH